MICLMIFIFFVILKGLEWFLACLDRFRHVLKAYIDLLKQPFKPAGGLCPPDPPISFEVLFFDF